MGWRARNSSSYVMHLPAEPTCDSTLTTAPGMCCLGSGPGAELQRCARCAARVFWELRVTGDWPQLACPRGAVYVQWRNSFSFINAISAFLSIFFFQRSTVWDGICFGRHWVGTGGTTCRACFRNWYGSRRSQALNNLHDFFSGAAKIGLSVFRCFWYILLSKITFQNWNFVYS